MQHPTIRIIQWVFLGVGLALLTFALLIDDVVGALIMLVMGLVFTGIGGGFMAYTWWSQNKEADLRQNGQLIQAEFQGVELNTSLEVNGAHPYRIVAHRHDIARNELMVYRSANLWFDPSPYIGGRSIPVYVDLNKPDRYHMDTSFLPKVSG